MRIYGIGMRRKYNMWSAHEIAAGHRSLTGTISCVTGTICFLPVTMTGRFSNFNSQPCRSVLYLLTLFCEHCKQWIFNI